MSWGYFLDLNLTVPTSEWQRLAQTKTGDHDIDASWWGFDEAALGTMFTAADFDDMTIGEAVQRFDREESIGRVITDGDTTTIRLIQLLDRGGDPSIAKAIAALVDAAKESANGTLRLVNDGSYSGEDGVEINAADGELSRKKIKGSMKLAVKLGSEMYGGVMDEADIDEAFEQMDDEADGEDGEDEDGDDEAPNTGDGAAQRVAAAMDGDDDEIDDELDQAFAGATVDEELHVEGAQAFAEEMGLTGEKPAAGDDDNMEELVEEAHQDRLAKAAAKKAGAKKAAAKKAAAKKPAAKKAVAKKPAAKKAAAKKAPAKKAPAKKAAAKKAPAKKAPAKKAAAKKPAAKKKRR